MDLKQIVEDARQEHIPLLLDETAEFLLNFLKDKNFKNILEIGTAVGYSGILFLQNQPRAFLTTIDINEKMQNIAKQNFKKFNVEKKVKLIKGDAKDVLSSFNQKFDLIFLDGPKGQYIKYLPQLKLLLDKNGFLIADNIFFHGKVRAEGFVPHKHRTIVVNLRKFIDAIENDEMLMTQIYDIGDGISISKLKK